MKANLKKLTEQGYKEMENGFYLLLKSGRKYIVYDFKNDVIVQKYFKWGSSNYKIK